MPRRDDDESDEGYGLERSESFPRPLPQPMPMPMPQPMPRKTGETDVQREEPAPARLIGTPDEEVIEHRSVRKRGGGGSASMTLNMTSMIDIVFLLLIYFIVATDFSAAEEAYRMDIPAREGASKADPFTLDSEPLRITVNSTGLAPDMYRLSLDGPYQQPATFDDLFAFLNSRQVRSDTTGGLFERDHPIVIQPTRTARWEHAMEAFNAAARARYTNVTFAKPG